MCQLTRQYSWIVLICVICTCQSNANAEGSSQRLLFLGPISPKVIDLEITSGRFSISATREKYTSGLFKLLDDNQDGSLNPEEAAQIPKDGRLRTSSNHLGDQWTKLDLEPEDEKISLAELRAHIESELGEPIRVERAAPRAVQTVRLYNDLDTNTDGRITENEVRNGLLGLQQFDFDDDETLSVAELQPFPLSVIQAQQQEQSEEEPLPLLLMNTEEQRRLAAERCVAQFGQAGVMPEELVTELAGRQARRFDRNRDRKYDAAEIAECFSRIPGQIQLLVSLAPPEVQVLSDANQRDPRPTLDLGGVPVEMMSKNTRWMASSNVGLLKTTRFANADQDGNKYLDQQEFVGLQVNDVEFTAVDIDGNEQVTRDEIGRFFTLDALARQARVVMSLSNEAKTLFDILDENNDFRLQPKEFREGRDNLLAFDLNKDESLVMGELASRFRITFSQPELFQFDPRNDMNAPNGRQGVVTEQTSGPVWFQRMDRNLDQEISWREFLGSRSDFDALDENKNGYLEAEEAEHAEKLRD